MTKLEFIELATKKGLTGNGEWKAALMYDALVNAGYEIVPAVENYGRFQGNDDN